MNKESLIEKLAAEANLSKKDAECSLESLVKIIISELKTGNSVTIVGFGTFSPRKRHARGGVNPQKPTERIQIPEVVVPKFKAGKTLKDALKK
ncbi:HU family DNA-binding protein [Candidatus Falkowbacteria bacterium CG10_big_fil_rev_8_21_14_0_10_43_11]|uniref:HU family DNA-binding protein n=1 Tax=Candidatus Falkowbacteria bacterium CG10_big_fil_rev_8_21_14_0_10_43_11 TaxID=1974568 RepID=A0A2M6WMT7_9BACT|nr:MAG: HU family DNA-binding protein [Candidatus Falkowbacteria bacterium CG10_big_fil_rev_8_21_14_0_10_43_11]